MESTCRGHARKLEIQDYLPKRTHGSVAVVRVVQQCAKHVITILEWQLHMVMPGKVDGSIISPKSGIMTGGAAQSKQLGMKLTGHRQLGYPVGSWSERHPLCALSPPG